MKLVQRYWFLVVVKGEEKLFLKMGNQHFFSELGPVPYVLPTECCQWPSDMNQWDSCSQRLRLLLFCKI